MWTAGALSHKDSCVDVNTELNGKEFFNSLVSLVVPCSDRVRPVIPAERGSTYTKILSDPSDRTALTAPRRTAYQQRRR